MLKSKQEVTKVVSTLPSVFSSLKVNPKSYTVKKGKRKVQGVPQSHAAALPRHQEEEEMDKTKQAQIEQTYESTKISFLFPKLGNHNAKRTEQHKNKITQGKTENKSPHRINHKATKNKN